VNKKRGKNKSFYRRAWDSISKNLLQSLPETVRMGIAGVAWDGLRLSWTVDGYFVVRQSREGHQTVERFDG